MELFGINLTGLKPVSADHESGLASFLSE